MILLKLQLLVGEISQFQAVSKCGEKAADEILALLKNNSSLKISIERDTDNAGPAERKKKSARDLASARISKCVLTSFKAQASNLID